MNKILLIGNGPSILNYEIGNKINDFPGEIIRFNAFKTVNFEKFIGTRIDIWVTCLLDHVIKRYANSYKLICFPLYQERYIQLQKKIINSIIFPQSIYNKTSILDDGRYFYPSSGLLSIEYFHEQNKQIFVHGFDNFQMSKHHYCDNQLLGINHNPELELIKFNEMTKKYSIQKFYDTI